MKNRLAIGLLAFVLAACAEPAAIWIAVTGPRDSNAPEDLVLEVGKTAWHGYGGVVSVESSDTVDVRLIGRESCRIYVHFGARPGTRWVIRFAEDGTVGIEDWTGQDMDAGPALTERPRSAC